MEEGANKQSSKPKQKQLRRLLMFYLRCRWLLIPISLHLAAADGHLDIVEYRISQGVDLIVGNKEKNIAHHWACLNGLIEI
ncbi:hypothetical protein SADUNF_Sadunf16G0160100 [Salix dunnii]|uniref:Uncharacterized protein n=1 Tax=Salix dunnii TaxID=1413687 RepID=A0A835J937_9ROSI|nr:hypothetical protein SADUNF_Sadunf16G0160100 [Salix dunnii]